MAAVSPGSPSSKPDPLALDQPKLLGALISSAFRLWFRRPGVFVLTASLIVIPFELIVLGVLGHGFQRNSGTADQWARLVSTVTINILGSALVTATHAKSVVALAEGKSLTTLGAFRLGLGGFALVVAAGLLYALATIVGFVLIIIPGIFITVAGVFTAQIAALERVGPVAALKASIALVRAAGWWRTWGYVIVISLIGTVFGAVVGGIFGALSASGGVFIVALAIIEAVTLSFTALITTLLYFSWKAQTQTPPLQADDTSPSTF